MTKKELRSKDILEKKSNYSKLFDESLYQTFKLLPPKPLTLHKGKKKTSEKGSKTKETPKKRNKKSLSRFVP